MLCFWVFNVYSCSSRHSTSQFLQPNAIQLYSYATFSLPFTSYWPSEYLYYLERVTRVSRWALTCMFLSELLFSIISYMHLQVKQQHIANSLLNSEKLPLHCFPWKLYHFIFTLETRKDSKSSLSFINFLLKLHHCWLEKWLNNYWLLLQRAWVQFQHPHTHQLTTIYNFNSRDLTPSLLASVGNECT